MIEIEWENDFDQFLIHALKNEFDFIKNMVIKKDAQLFHIPGHGLIILEMIVKNDTFTDLFILGGFGKNTVPVIESLKNFCKKQCVNLITHTKINGVKKLLINNGFNQTVKNGNHFIYQVRG